ncbi:MAG TPA: uracil-DNA glycosylase family protein [Devosia sp.]|nr:uracil-DNA glycosylase family protein [Devosia sp.]
MTADPSLDSLVEHLRACRVCRDAPLYQPPLPHEPRPIVQISSAARICIASQAPGIRAHNSGVPFSDPSGVRLRAWLGLDEPTFYDAQKLAIVPMAFCFPGNDAHGGDLPPRRECAPLWRARLFAQMPQLELVLLIGQYAQKWHLGSGVAAAGMTATVANWRELYVVETRPRLLPLPHPSWRNSGWLKRNPWFEAELLPVLRADIARLTA